MKLLKSYKKIAKEFIKEAAWDRKFGEPLPTLEDVMKENTVKFKDKDGKDHEIDMDTAKQYKKDVDGGDDSDYKKTAVKAAGLDKDDKDSEQPSGKALGGSDFERDFDDKGDEPKDEPKGDGEPKDSELASKLSKMDDDEFEKEMDDIRDQAKNLAFQKMYSDPTSTAYMGGAPSEKEEEEFRKKYDAYQAEYEKRNPQDEPEDKPKDEPKKKGFFSKMFGKKESIKVINGQKYKAIKESKEPTKPTIHPFKKMYKRIGGK